MKYVNYVPLKKFLNRFSLIHAQPERSDTEKSMVAQNACSGLLNDVPFVDSVDTKSNSSERGAETLTFWLTILNPKSHLK